MLSGVDRTKWILRGDVPTANHANVYRQLLQHAHHFHMIDAQQAVAVYLQKQTVSIAKVTREEQKGALSFSVERLI